MEDIDMVVAEFGVPVDPETGEILIDESVIEVDAYDGYLAVGDIPDLELTRNDMKGLSLHDQEKKVHEIIGLMYEVEDLRKDLAPHLELYRSNKEYVDLMKSAASKKALDEQALEKWKEELPKIAAEQRNLAKLYQRDTYLSSVLNNLGRILSALQTTMRVETSG